MRRRCREGVIPSISSLIIKKAEGVTDPVCGAEHKIVAPYYVRLLILHIDMVIDSKIKDRCVAEEG
jgi:hypothetical protein